MTTKISPTSPHVYQAIAAVTEALSHGGIAKGRKATTGGASYNFRGIDDVYNTLAPLLAEHKLCILPQVLDRTCEERQSRSGGALFYVNITVRFDFVSAVDGTTHQVATFGEAMDSGDKATNKAMSAAYKYAAMMAFCIPTIGEDSENETHEVRPTARMPAKAPAEPADDALLDRVYDEANRGSVALRAFWGILTTTERKTIGKLVLENELKPIAEEADKQIEIEKQNPATPPVRSRAPPTPPKPESASSLDEPIGAIAK